MSDAEIVIEADAPIDEATMRNAFEAHYGVTEDQARELLTPICSTFIKMVNESGLPMELACHAAANIIDAHVRMNADTALATVMAQRFIGLTVELSQPQGQPE